MQIGEQITREDVYEASGTTGQITHEGPGKHLAGAFISNRAACGRRWYQTTDPLLVRQAVLASTPERLNSQPEVIAKILTHLGLWPAPAHSPPAAEYPLPSAPQWVAAA